MALGEASVKIVADTSDFEATLKKGVDGAMDGVDKRVKETTDEIGKKFKKSSEQSEKSIQGLNDQLKQVGKTVVAAFAAREVFNFAKGALEAAESAAVAENRLRAIATAMGTFGDEVDTVTQRMVAYSETMARATGIDDEQIQMVQAKLLVFKSVGQSAGEMGGMFDRATQAALDLGAATGRDATTAALMLGKALQDPVNGTNALVRAGIKLTEVEKEQVQAFLDANDVIGAQEYVLSLIEGKVGGTAEATATASSKMRYAFGELQEEIGKALLPAFESLTKVLIPIFDAFSKLPKDISGFGATVALSTALTASMSRALQGLGIAAGVAKVAMGALNIALIAFATYQQQEANNAAAMIASYKKLATATDEQVLAQEKNIEVLRNLQGLSPEEFFKDFAEAQQGAAQRLVEAGVAQEAFGVSTEAATKILDEQIKAQQQAAEDTDRAASALDNAGAAADMASAQMRDYVEGLGFVVDESGNVEYSQENLAKAVEIAQKRFDDAVKAVEDYEQAISDAFSAARESIDTGYALVKSQDDANTAFQEYTKALNEGNLSQEEADRLARQTAMSFLEVADATVRNEETMRAMNGESLTTAERQQMMIDALDRFRSTLDPASPLAQYLSGFIQTLGGIPTDIPVELTAEVTSAQTELETFKTAALEIGNQITLGILQALAPLSPEFKKLLDKMLYEAGRDISFNVRMNITASGAAYITTPYGSMPVSAKSNATVDVGNKVQTTRLPAMAVGGIVDSPQVALIGEAGREAVIPLTRPARAMELMRESGLLGLAQTSTSNQNFDIQVVSAQPMRTARDVVREFQALEYRMSPI